MNKLIIIGNGFDLAHGLPTRYSDFINWYLNKEFEQFKNSNRKPGSIYEYNGDLIKITGEFKLNSKYSSLRKAQDEGLVKVIAKHDFINTLISLNDKSNWVDIEYLYYNELRRVARLREKRSPESCNCETTGVDDLNKYFNTIKNEFLAYLETINFESVEVIDEINEHLDDIINGDKRKGLTKILVFNYTETIELYESTNSKKVTIWNIHGKLSDKKASPLVFGYGDEMDPFYKSIENFNDNEYLKYFKSFEYFKTNIYQSLIRFIESEKYKVFIMGHSCGLSDRVLLNTIFENPNCIRIKLYYYQKNETENDFFQKTMEISRHFKNKKTMREIISPFTNSKPIVRPVIQSPGSIQCKSQNFSPK